MTMSNSLLAYQDCTDLLQKAVEDKVGVRVKVADQTSAIHLRNRLHYARRLHREENAKTYDEGEFMHGRSEYDGVVVRMKMIEEQWYIYLERLAIDESKIESLTGLQPIEDTAEPIPDSVIKELTRRV